MALIKLYTKRPGVEASGGTPEPPPITMGGHETKKLIITISTINTIIAIIAIITIITIITSITIITYTGIREGPQNSDGWITIYSACITNISVNIIMSVIVSVHVILPILY